MPIEDAQPPGRGDEAALYASYHAELDRRVTNAVNTSRENIEDACAFAWAQFVRRQPDRRLNWRGWLFRTAQRRAWELDREWRSTRHVMIAFDPDDGRGVPEPRDPVDRLAQRTDLDDVVEVLSQLPERRRRVALLHALGYSYAELAELNNVSMTRIGHLVREATARVEEVRLAAPPDNPSGRAQRLWQLEHEPPEWLTRLIGSPNRGSGTHKLRWRRAALALDDLRREQGGELRSPEDRSSLTPAMRRALERVDRAREALAETRRPGRDRDR